MAIMTESGSWVISFDHRHVRIWISQNELPDCYDVTNNVRSAKQFHNEIDAKDEMLRLGLSGRWKVTQIAEGK